MGCSSSISREDVWYIPDDVEKMLILESWKKLKLLNGFATIGQKIFERLIVKGTNFEQFFGLNNLADIDDQSAKTNFHFHATAIRDSLDKMLLTWQRHGDKQFAERAGQLGAVHAAKIRPTENFTVDGWAVLPDAICQAMSPYLDGIAGANSRQEVEVAWIRFSDYLVDLIQNAYCQELLLIKEKEDAHVPKSQLLSA